MNELMTSVADTHTDADDDLTEISPELVLVDPELARRLREREPAPVFEDVRPAPLLRLVQDDEPEQPASTVVYIPPLAPPPVEPIEAPLEASEEEEEAEEEAPSEPASELEPATDQPLPRVVIDVDELIVPRVVDDEERASARSVRFEPTPPLPPVAPAPRSEPMPEHPAPTPPVPTLATDPEPLPEPAPAPVSVTPPSGRRGLGIRIALGAVIATALVAAVLELSGESPLPAAGTPSWPVAGDPPQSSAPTTSRPTTSDSPAASTPKPKPAKKKPPKAAQANPPAKAKTTPKAKAKSTTPKARQTANPPASAPQTRRFAWAPAAGAVGYHVELFRGSDRVLARDTKRPVLELEPTWRYEGKAMRLTDGEYRWYVWSVTSSGRNPQAIVQATLSVP